MSNDMDSTARQVIEIAHNAVGSGNQIDPAAAGAALGEMERLGPLASQAIVMMMVHQPVRTVLSQAGEPGLKHLDEALKDPDRQRREAALTALGQVHPAPFERLIEVMRTDSDSYVRRIAACTLGRLGEEGLAVLKEALDSRDEEWREVALDGIARTVYNAGPNPMTLAPSSEPLIEVFINCTEDKNPKIRTSAIDFLAQYRRIPIESVDKALDDEDPEVREAALRALSHFAIDSSNAKTLVKVFEDANGEIAKKAVNRVSARSYDAVADVGAVADAVIDLLIVRASNRPGEHFNPEIVVQALQEAFKKNPRLYGRTLQQLRDLAYAREGAVRRRATFVGLRLNKEEFTALINEQADGNPKAARAIARLMGTTTDSGALVDQISETDPRDIQRIAGTQIKLLESYNRDVLSQARTSFAWAIIASVLGLASIILAIAYLMGTRSLDLVSAVTTGGGIIAEFIAGTLFYLYRQSQKQVAFFYKQLNQIQRFLLANSVCESLEGDAKQKSRADLVRLIATLEGTGVDLPVAAKSD